MVRFSGRVFLIFDFIVSFNGSNSLEPRSVSKQIVTELIVPFLFLIKSVKLIDSVSGFISKINVFQ